jgi:proteasome lid subunit RPN8/RPN11
VNSKQLLEYYAGPHERVGFILDGGEIVECKNIAEKPEDTFEVDPAEVVLHADAAVATWHTHPGGDNNLSANDYEMFLAWPGLTHFIVGENGVQAYTVEDGDVLIA